MPNPLHPHLLARIPFSGQKITTDLAARADRISDLTTEITHPDVSIVIRARNNAAQLAALLKDIRVQKYAGEVETVVVDTESTDGSIAVAQAAGATVVNIAQNEFSYPKALNLGFEAAKNPWVFSFVDHSLLTHWKVLHVAAHWDGDASVSAVFGTVLPNSNASRTECLTAAIGLRNYFRREAIAVQPKLGFMMANALAVRRERWSEAGGFDEAYGAGGEDGALGKAMLAAGGVIIEDPALTVHPHMALARSNRLLSSDTGRHLLSR